MSDAADRRIAELEQRVKELGWENDNLRKSREVLGKQSAELHDRDLRHIESLRKQLVERDVYEAQQILPPEQAALIKHLATVERCIEYGHYDVDAVIQTGDMFCAFCIRGEAHDKDCAWLALQFDRKPAETMALVEGWAWEENARRDRERAEWEENDRRDRERARAMTATEASLRFGDIRRELRAPRVGPRASKAADASRFYFGPTAPALGDPLDLEALSEHPAVTAVAPPDDEDVP